MQMDPAQVEPVTQAMGKFVQLLRHKQFLVLLVRTLEVESARGGLSMSERLRFASLLSAFLQAKMDTYTQVLKALLHEQLVRLVGEARRAPHERSTGFERDSDAYQSINGLHAASGLSLNSPRSRSLGSGLDGGLPAPAVESGRSLHLRTFLRRNESIAEKMLTNWFAFLLYHQLKVRVLLSPILLLLYLLVLACLHEPAYSFLLLSGERWRASLPALLCHRIPAQQRPGGHGHARGPIRARRELPPARSTRPFAHRALLRLFTFH